MQTWSVCREGLPELASARATLRELQLSDASSLLSVLKKPEMRSFVADEPDSLDGVEKFIEWTHRGRRTGRHLCYGVVPAGGSTAVGLFQVSSMDPMGRTVEWGFMLDRSLWGCALLQECAGVLVDFVVEALGVQRLEARVAVSNARGTAALHRLGAVREAILRQCFLINGVQTDHAMWSILASDWNALRPGRGGRPARASTCVWNDRTFTATSAAPDRMTGAARVSGRQITRLISGATN